MKISDPRQRLLHFAKRHAPLKRTRVKVSSLSALSLFVSPPSLSPRNLFSKPRPMGVICIEPQLQRMRVPTSFCSDSRVGKNKRETAARRVRLTRYARFFSLALLFVLVLFVPACKRSGQKLVKTGVQACGRTRMAASEGEDQNTNASLRSAASDCNILPNGKLAGSNGPDFFLRCCEWRTNERTNERANGRTNERTDEWPGRTDVSADPV